MKAVLDAFDAELQSLGEEITELESKLDTARTHIDRIEKVRAQAAELDGGGMAPAEAPTGTAGNATSKASVSGTFVQRSAAGGTGRPAGRVSGPRRREAEEAKMAADEEKVLEAVRALGPRVARGAIAEKTGLTPITTKRALQRLAERGKVTKTGQRAGTRYSAKGAQQDFEKGPSEASASAAPTTTDNEQLVSEGGGSDAVGPPASGAASPPGAPLADEHSIKLDLPDRPVSAVAAASEEAERSKRAQRANQAGSELQQAILDVLRERDEPMRGRELNQIVGEQLGIPVSKVTPARTRLSINRLITPIDRPDGVYYIFGATMTRPTSPGANGEGPRTRTEQRVYDAVGPGLTASEVSFNAGIQATPILEGLVRRGVLRRREGSSPTVYEKPEQLEAAA